jgi:RHS repeat-associated protein
VLSTYTQEKGAAAEQEEVPVYGASCLGVYKPKHQSMFYELTDHLGTVRAVIGDNMTLTYLATMETERAAEEDKYFDNLDRGPTSSQINHTPGQVIVDGKTDVIANPNEVVRINNGVTKKSVGGGIMLRVYPGDVVDMEVFAKYAQFDKKNNNALGALASYLTNTFVNKAPVLDGVSVFHVVDDPDFLLLPAWDKFDENEPRAYLNYLLFDNQFKLTDFDFDQVSENADIAGSGASAHEQLALSLNVKKEGILYIYLSNESDQNMDVYFDDLKVTHKYSDIVAGGDYYPFGLAMEDRQISREAYKYGYQGQFAEKDVETSWNHFELREYDPVIGRWTAKDLAGQYFSPYVGMGNNPVNLNDPNGAYSWFGSWWRNGFSSEGMIYDEVNEDWGYQTNGIENGEVWVSSDFGDRESRNRSFWTSDVWNSAFARANISDYYSFSLTFGGGFIFNAEAEPTFTLMLRGQDPGLYYNTTLSLTVGTSVGPTASVTGGSGYFNGDPRNFSSEALAGPKLSLQGGIAAKFIAGGGVGRGVDIGLDGNNKISTIGTKSYLSIGVGAAPPIDVAAGFGVGSTPAAIFKFK